MMSDSCGIIKDNSVAAPLAARKYQLDLLEYVTHENGIIYLPTGAGKTYVAILALKRFSTNMDRTIANGGKRGIFMCNTVELARQQAVAIRNHSNLKVGLYLGERDVDNWQPKKWKEEIDENQVLVGTAQIFVNIVSGNYIKISDLSIVVFDECHHGTKSHPMHEFMRMFQHVPQHSPLPRVIGLTGVLLKGNKLNNFMESLRNLEVTFRSKIVTVTSSEFMNVMVHSTNPEEKMLLYGPTFNRSSMNQIIETEINKCLLNIDNFDLGKYPVVLSKGLAVQRDPNKKSTAKNLLKDILFHLEEYGIYCSLFALDIAVIELEVKERQSETVPLRRMYRVVISSLELVRHLIFKNLKEYVDVENPTNSDCHNEDVIFNFSTPKLTSLLQYLILNFGKKERKDITCLLFVERRLTARAICNVIQKFIQLKPILKEILVPEFMVGRNSMSLTAVENVLERKWNRKVMTNFRNGICNMIVCSSVLEEGIDVQACNHVIVFDALKTFNSYIQTKGRARTKNSTYTITTSQINKNKVIEQIMSYKRTHEAIKTFLFERTLLTPHPNEEEINTEFDEKMTPLRSPQGACLLPSSALAMLNRYCQMLPWDMFGCTLPQFIKLPSGQKSGVIVSLKLPLQSRVKEEILSDPMENTKVAKISAALKACKRLYEEGELNESLVPTSKNDCIKNVSSDLFKHWEKFQDSVISKKDGKAKQRLYERKCPEELYNSMPIVGEVCYAYEILFTTEFELNDYNAHVVDALKTNLNYAILLRKRLPSIAAMPLFMRQGSLNVRILDKPMEFRINSKEKLEQLKKYHIMVMRDILKCWRSYYVQDSRNKQNSFLIVPYYCGSIDWGTVIKFDRLKPLKQPTLSERQNRCYRPEDWLGKTVAKWYSADTSERFIVTKVCTDQSPLSKFPNDSHVTYQQFFETRYGKAIGQIVNRNQFLIEVKPFTARRNFFNNAKSKDSVIKKDTQKVVLLPELCHNFEHRGDLWLKALFLPSILHRLHFMLHAENLRKRVNSFLGLTDQFSEYKPKPLFIDRSLRRAVDSDGNACVVKEDCPVLLPPIPPSEEVFEVVDLGTTNALWTQYMEPIDFSRQANSIYPLEMEYYYKFIMEKEKILLTEPLMEYSNRQFQIATPFNRSQYEADPNFISTAAEQMGALAISDVPLEEKSRIRILERSMFRKDFLPSLIMPAEQHDFVAALTTSGANDVFDMERFELLGDSFLKFSISLYLAHKYPKWHEGFLTEVKSKLVSNRNLLYCLLDTDIPTRICSELFRVDEWLPPLISLPDDFLSVLEKDPEMRALVSARDLYDIELDESEVLSGHCNAQHFTQFKSAFQRNEVLLSDGLELNLNNDLNFCTYKEVRADKIVADTLEALLGVCVKNYGLHMSFQMLEFFGVCRPKLGDKPLTSLLDLELGGRLQNTDLSAREIDSFIINYQLLEINLGYHFRDRAYLLQALTHPSYPMNRITGCYQELEFIGDAILDILVSCYIFERYETMTPGKLTDMRSALVNNITLACICVRRRFHLFLLAENAILAESIKKFVEFQEISGNRVTDQVHILMEEGDTQCNAEFKANIAVNVEVPKVLGDILEAIIAAVYLDSRCLETTWKVVYQLLEYELNEFSHKVPIDPVRQLYEHPSARPQFSDPITDKDTTLVRCVFSCRNKTVTVNGFGMNRRQAKKSAAKHALQILSKT